MKHNLFSNLRTHLRLTAIVTVLAVAFASCQKEEVEQPKSATPEISTNVSDTSRPLRIIGKMNVKASDSLLVFQSSNTGYAGSIQVFRVQGYAPGYSTPYLWFPKRYVWRSSYSSQAQIVMTSYTIYKRLAGTSTWYYYDQVSPSAVAIPAGYGGAYLDPCYKYINFDTRGSSYYKVVQTVTWYNGSFDAIGKKTIWYNGAGGYDYENPSGYANLKAYADQIYFLGY